MKDVKVYDGSGWQSLKGPPGPQGEKGDKGDPGESVEVVEYIPAEFTVVNFDGGVAASTAEVLMKVVTRSGTRTISFAYEFRPASTDTLILLPTASAAFTTGAYSSLMATAIYAIDVDTGTKGVSLAPWAVSIRYIGKSQVESSFVSGSTFDDLFCISAYSPSGAILSSDYTVVVNITYEEA